MRSYVVLLRGVNVGGKNKVSMAVLRECLEALGFSQVSTYIASGNVVLRADKKPAEIQKMVEATLVKNFTLDTKLIKVLVVSRQQLQDIVDNRPKEFGGRPETYRSDVIFLMDIPLEAAMETFHPREGVDKVWSGAGVVYSQRVIALATKSQLSKMMLSPLYKSMTIRNWNTTVKLLELVNALEKVS